MDLKEQGIILKFGQDSQKCEGMVFSEFDVTIDCALLI